MKKHWHQVPGRGDQSGFLLKRFSLSKWNNLLIISELNSGFPALKACLNYAFRPDRIQPLPESAQLLLSPVLFATPR
jgi:hypothetical protein